MELCPWRGVGVPDPIHGVSASAKLPQLLAGAQLQVTPAASLVLALTRRKVIYKHCRKALRQSPR